MTLIQIAAFLAFLSAFGVDQPTLNNVHAILDPSFATTTSAFVLPAASAAAPATIRSMNTTVSASERADARKRTGDAVGHLSLIGGKLSVSVSSFFADEPPTVSVDGTYLPRGTYDIPSKGGTCSAIVGSSLLTCGANWHLELGAGKSASVTFDYEGRTTTETIGPSDATRDIQL